MLNPWRFTFLLVVAIGFLASSVNCASLWRSRLGSSEVEVVWNYRRGEIDGDSAAKKVSQRNRFLAAIYGAAGFAAVGAVLGGVSSGGAGALPGIIIGAIAGAIDPLGTSESVQHFDLVGKDSSVSKYKLMKGFFSGTPDLAVARSYSFFGCSSHETEDELNNALMRKRMQHCEAKKDEAYCELTEYHFEMIRAYRN